MSFRVIRGLKWARACQRPAGIPYSRPRGAKAAGLRYERELAKAIPGALHGQWWEFEDLGGHGHCQTDIIMQLSGGGVLVLEAKYTWTLVGHEQAERLYLPVVRKALGDLVLPVVVCKVLTTEVPRNSICRSLDEAEISARAGRRTVLHWVGGLGPLQPAPSRAHLAPSLSTL